MRLLALCLVPCLLSACASSPETTSDPLSGTDWELRALVRGADSLGTLPADGLHFLASGEIRIRSCNVCNGRYSVEGGVMRTDGLACTRMACPAGTPDLGSLVGDAARFRFRGDWLIIEPIGDASARIYFAPGPPLEGS